MSFDNPLALFDSCSILFLTLFHSLICYNLLLLYPLFKLFSFCVDSTFLCRPVLFWSALHCSVRLCTAHAVLCILLICSALLILVLLCRLCSVLLFYLLFLLLLFFLFCCVLSCFAFFCFVLLCLTKPRFTLCWLLQNTLTSCVTFFSLT